MNKIHSLMLAAIVSPVFCSAAEQYELKPAADAHFSLEIYKTGLLAGKKHHFEFSAYEGRLQYDKNQPSNAHLHLTVESKTGTCQDDWVKPKDLAKIQIYALQEMLDAERYPQITFDSKSIEPAGDNRFTVAGQLTIRDRSKPVNLSVKQEAGKAAGTLRFTGQAAVKLTDYGLKPPTAALGAIGTKDEMTVVFDLIATPAP